MEKYTHFRTKLDNKGEIIPIKDIDKYVKSKEVDYYSNLYWFNADVITYFNNNGKSISGYNGGAYSEKLIFDFDSREDVNKAKIDTINLLGRLQEIGVDINKSVNIFFSGSKGTHVEVLTNNKFTPEQLKNICSRLAGDLPSFDTSIYSLVRAYRISNTKHNKSGLYKIPVELKTLTSSTIDEIKELAKEPRYPVPTLIPTEVDFNKYAIEVKKVEVIPVESEEDENGIRGLDLIDFTKCPKSMPRCYYILSKGVAVPGERSRVFHILAKYYRNQGYDQRVTHGTLKGIAELNHQLYPEFDKITKEEIFTQHIASAYSLASLKHQKPNGTGTSSDNELLLKYCKAIKSDCKCSLHNGKTFSSVVKIGDVSSMYEVFASELDKNIIKTGIQALDNKAQLTIGTTNMIVGAIGSGKTTCVFNILENSNRLDQPSIFFSMDTNRFLVFQNLAKKVTNYTIKQVQEFYKTKNTKKIQEIKEAINQKFGKTYFDFTSSDSLDNMADKIKTIEDKEGKKIKLAIVDYCGKVSSNYSDEFSNARFNATKSSGIADDTGACWVYLSQISRQSGDATTPLKSSRLAKDTSAWEEVSSNIINIWRPFANIPDQDNVMKLYLAKSRGSSTGEFILHWDGAKGNIEELDQSEVDWYKENREMDEPGNRKR